MVVTYAGYSTITEERGIEKRTLRAVRKAWAEMPQPDPHPPFSPVGVRTEHYLLAAAAPAIHVAGTGTRYPNDECGRHSLQCLSLSLELMLTAIIISTAETSVRGASCALRPHPQPP